jgi:hypothetical protein
MKYILYVIVAAGFLLCSMSGGRDCDGCKDYGDFAVSISGALGAYGNWRCSLLDDRVEIRSLVDVPFCADVSPAPISGVDSDCRKRPIILRFYLMVRRSDVVIRKACVRNDSLARSVSRDMKLKESKTYFLDSKDPAVQVALREGYDVLPTHRVDRCHDLLAVTVQPSYFESPCGGHPVTDEYAAILGFVDGLYARVEGHVSTRYLGVLGEGIQE